VLFDSINVVGTVALSQSLLVKLLEELGLKGDVVAVQVEIFACGRRVAFVELA
jgi:ribosomal protein S28E/S33